jgi:biopolymer transport protein ExbD
MKFPRNTRIFRGQLDMAPVACLFFATALMLFLHSQIVFVPGVRLDLHPSTDTNRPSLFIDSEDLFHYADSTMSQAAFVKRLRADAEKGRAPNTIIFQADIATSTNALNAIRIAAAELSIALEPPGMRIALPVSTNQPGVNGPSVIVAVNANGQFFYQNQLVQKESDLAAKLAQAAAASRQPLTLELKMDRAVVMDTFVKLSDMARNAGFEKVVIATRPALRPVENPNLEVR